MDSIKNLFKIGNGPSSSHTMGPSIAAKQFLERNKDAKEFKVELFGSLALTGKGHLTDVTIQNVLGKNRTTITFNLNQLYTYHTNAMRFEAISDGLINDSWLVFSVGGGSLKELNEPRNTSGVDIYPHYAMSEILKYCDEEKITLNQYVDRFEGDISDYLNEILMTMKEAIKTGINKVGYLPGGLNVERKSAKFYERYLVDKSINTLVFAYALATAEENGSGGVIVTSPTCGASGVLPGALMACREIYNYSDEKLIEAIKIAGLVGNLIKFNGSISGAEVGCQGEVGAACSMTAAAICFLFGGTNQQIEYAAEIGLEHHLGLTCDPVGGLVQIPCIERNALASAKAIDAANYAIITDGKHYISLDSVIEVMKQTGMDLHNKYKETSVGGLATKIID